MSRKSKSLLLLFVGFLMLVGCGGPAFQQWESADVVEAFRAAGLECESTRPMEKADYGMAPMTAVEGTRFLVPSLGPDNGGRILRFENEADLVRMRDYYVKAGEASAMLFSWVFVKDNIVVQINGDLPEEQAKKYEAALNGLK